MKKWVSIIALSFLVSCTGENPAQPLTVDGSSKTSFDQSVEAINQSLSETRLEDFQAAIAAHVLAESFSHDDLLANDDSDAILNHVRSRLNGKTADQIIEEAESISDQ